MADHLRAIKGTTQNPLVHILMATHQGERYLEAQLESIHAQTHTHWVLHVSDDGSEDFTHKKLQDFIRHRDLANRVHFYNGPQLGSTSNFLHLIGLMKPITQNPDCRDLFAFCDQDDVWLPDKLKRAVDVHQSLGQGDHDSCSEAILYASTTIICDEDLRPLRNSKLPKGEFSMHGALIQNLLSGNTMVMNTPLVRLLQKIDPSHSVWHDWTTFMAVVGCGGRVHVDANPSVLYRQHGGNVIGEQSKGLKTQSMRFNEIRLGRYRAWMEKNRLATQDIWEDLTPTARSAFKSLQEIQMEERAIKRLSLAIHSGLKRQGALSQLAFWFICALGWI